MVSVNCWFCNQDSEVEEQETDGWQCQLCQQYNGFTLDGDYNTEVPGQRDVKHEKTDTVCESGHFDTAGDVLCAACSTNQVLKVRQLATFRALSEESFDEELESYRHYLENVYKLCDVCQQKVEESVGQQDRLLQSKMSSAQLKKLKAVGAVPDKAPSEYFENVPNILRGVRLPSAAELLFTSCLVLALVRVFMCLRLYAGVAMGTGSGKPHFQSSMARLGHRFMSWIVGAVSAQTVLAWEDSVVYMGAAGFVGGLFLSGKYRLYLEDSLLLLLWLATILTSTAGSTTMLHHTAGVLRASEGAALGLAIVTALLALVACLRHRRPKHFSQLFVARKDVPFLGSSDKESDKKNQTKLPSTNSSISSESDTPPPFEDIRQDFETFSLGLNKKSHSKSSIWSLPAVVTSSTSLNSDAPSSPTADGNTPSDPIMTPDSTSDLPARSRSPGLERSILTPSRLGFLSFDSSAESRSPSPWESILPSDFDSDDDSSPPKAPNLQQHPLQGSLLTFSQSFSPNRKLSPGKSQPLSQQRGSDENYSMSQSSDLKDRLHPSQSGLGGLSPHSFSSSHYEQRGVPSGMQVQNSLHSPQLMEQPMPGGQQTVTEPNSGWGLTQTSPSGETKGVRRRSQRLAMAGRRPKPWPLRKSLSCNNALDRDNLEVAGLAARLQSPSSVTRTDFGSKGSSVLDQNISQHSQRPVSHLSPLGEKTQGQFFHHTNAGTSYPSSSFFPAKSDNNSSSTSWRADCPTTRPLFASHSRTTRTHLGGDGGEFSDCEDMEVDQPWDHGASSKARRRLDAGSRLTGSDKSWKWILLGTVIGASVTSNIFLVLHQWLGS